METEVESGWPLSNTSSKMLLESNTESLVLLKMHSERSRPFVMYYGNCSCFIEHSVMWLLVCAGVKLGLG